MGAFLKVALIIISLSSIFIISTSASASALGMKDDIVAATTSAPGLDCSVNYNPITWLLCPVISGINGLVDGLDGAITDALNINTCTYFNAPGSGADALCSGNRSTGTQSSTQVQASTGFYTAWSELRDIALGLMVVGALIMIIAQILGFEILDAYTIRKVLPRIIIAAIAISLSWQLMQFFIQLSNDFGQGVADLIYQPFKNLTASGGIQVNANVAGTASSAAAILGIAAIANLGLIATLTFGLIAVIAVGLGFIVIVLRQILVIFLALLSPIAIAMFILPGTSRVWKLWSNTFMKALIMFPLIAGMIAIGRVFAEVSSTSGGVVGQFIAYIAYFGPYFIIPQTFKFAGGILAGAGGAAGNARKSFSKSAAGYRARERKRIGELNAKGERFKHGKQSGVSGFLNRRTMGISTGSQGRFGLGKKGTANINRVQRDRDAANLAGNKTIENLAQNSPEGIAILAGSGGTLAGAKAAQAELKAVMMKNGVSESDAEARTQSGLLAAQAAGITTSNSRTALNAGAATKWRALGSNGGGQFLENAVNRAYGDKSIGLRGDALQTLAFNNRKNGRTDMGGVVGDKLSAKEGYAKAGAQATVRDSPDSLRVQTSRIHSDLKTAITGGDFAGAVDAGAQLAALRGAMGPDLTLESQKILTDTFTAAGIDISRPEDIHTQLAAMISPLDASTTPAQVTNILKNRTGAWNGPPMGGGP